MRRAINAFLIFLCGLMIVVSSEMATETVIQKVHNSPKYLFTLKDESCLADAVYYESRGEPIEGQRAVAQVVYNRWKSFYRKSICQIVYQKSNNGCQFAWVCNPTVAKVGHNNWLWKQALRIASSILRTGDCGCKVRDSIYFTRADSVPDWLIHKRRIRQIGHHVFYA